MRRVYGRPDPVGVMTGLSLTGMQANADVLIAYVGPSGYQRFYFFIPPYSILFRTRNHPNGTTEHPACAAAAGAGGPEPADNVRLYYFMNEAEVVCDAENHTGAPSTIRRRWFGTW